MLPLCNFEVMSSLASPDQPKIAISRSRWPWIAAKDVWRSLLTSISNKLQRHSAFLLSFHSLSRPSVEPSTVNDTQWCESTTKEGERPKGYTAVAIKPIVYLPSAFFVISFLFSKLILCTKCSEHCRVCQWVVKWISREGLCHIKRHIPDFFFFRT